MTKHTFKIFRYKPTIFTYFKEMSIQLDGNPLQLKMYGNETVVR
ncbi:hypothetical protein ACFOZY_02950 [Chungangia koreensis]|uniref:Uncharacterized protein n=1 Tax=Chungangia koreensis TaxID=752657 RepID=A0ABV8X0X5_9LACT